MTLAAVARDAGVSVATVSEVANGRTDLASETRARVGELLTRHGYVARGHALPTPTIPVVADVPSVGATPGAA